MLACSAPVGLPNDSRDVKQLLALTLAVCTVLPANSVAQIMRLVAGELCRLRLNCLCLSLSLFQNLVVDQIISISVSASHVTARWLRRPRHCTVVLRGQYLASGQLCHPSLLPPDKGSHKLSGCVHM